MRAAVAWCCVPIIAWAVLAPAAPVSAGYASPPPFEPQGTLLWDFPQSEWTEPESVAGPTWDEGFWTCDDTAPSSSLRWYDTCGMWPGHQGLIGYDNSNGEQTVNCSLTIHISNYNDLSPLKLIWCEMEVYPWGEVASIGAFSAAEGYTVEKTNDTYEQLPEGGSRVNEKWEIRPNPSWEEFGWGFSVPAGGGILLDNFYISTPCVPEPGSLMVLMTGLAGIVGVVVRRRR